MQRQTTLSLSVNLITVANVTDYSPKHHIVCGDNFPGHRIISDENCTSLRVLHGFLLGSLGGGVLFYTLNSGYFYFANKLCIHRAD